MLILKDLYSNSRNVFSKIRIINKDKNTLGTETLKIYQGEMNHFEVHLFSTFVELIIFSKENILCAEFNKLQFQVTYKRNKLVLNEKFEKNYVLELIVQVLFKFFKIMMISQFFISMYQFSLLAEWDKIRYLEQSESVNVYGNFVQDSSYPHLSLSSKKSQNPTIQDLLSTNVLSGYELANQISNESVIKKQNQRLSQSYQQVNTHLFVQSCIDQRDDIAITKLCRSNLQESQKNQKKRNDTSQNHKIRKRKRIKKQDKNQYDKNIPGHIVSTVVNQILKPAYKQELQFYCKKMKNLTQNQHTTYLNIIEFAKSVKERSTKFGTSQLGHFFGEKNLENDLQKVFGLFMVRFLKQQYILHILSVGKMSNKQKYLECATNMMYIPKLCQEEYSLIHQFYRKDV